METRVFYGGGHVPVVLARAAKAHELVDRPQYRLPPTPSGTDWASASAELTSAKVYPDEPRQVGGAPNTLACFRLANVSVLKDGRVQDEEERR